VHDESRRIVNGNSNGLKGPIGTVDWWLFLGGVPESSAGNVANSQPHVPRLIRAGAPPSSIEYVYEHPVRVQRVGLGSRGEAPGRLRSRRWGSGRSPDSY